MKTATMKVVFVNRFFYPDHSATSQMLSDLAFQLADDGVSITVITSRQRYDDASAVLDARETVGGVDIVRVWTSRFGRDRLIGRLFDYLSFYVTSAWAMLLQLRRGDTLVVKTDPPMLSVIAAPIAWWRGARLINWLQDVFPEIAERLSGAKPGFLSRTLFSTLRFLRNRSLRAADLSVVLGERMSAHLSAQRIPETQLQIIPNWSDGRRISPVVPEANALRNRWGLNNTFVVGYSGNLGRAHDITTMVEAMAETEARTVEGSDAVVRPIHWLFIGGGASMTALKTEVDRLGLRHVHFHPYQPRDALSESLSAADVHLVSLRPELEGLIVPSKYYGIAAAGRPVIFIGDDQGEI
ncbi:MAG: glycosyltransferase family 4 protein, partial [Pseudomonadota bacterium]